MARTYMISKSLGGAKLQISEEGSESESVKLQAVSDPGLRREAEEIINSRFYSMSPFPGFHWQSMGSNGWMTTDHDLRS